MALYLIKRAEEGLAVFSLRVARAAIRAAHHLVVLLIDFVSAPCRSEIDSLTIGDILTIGHIEIVENRGLSVRVRVRVRRRKADQLGKGRFARAERVHEDENPEFLTFCPERMEFGIGQFVAGGATPHPYATEAERLDCVFGLLHGEIGILQSRGGEADEAVGVGRAELDQGLVLDFDQLGRGIALGAVPVWVNAQRLDIYALRIHCCDASSCIGHQQTRCFERVVDQRHRSSQVLKRALEQPELCPHELAGAFTDERARLISEAPAHR